MNTLCQGPVAAERTELLCENDKVADGRAAPWLQTPKLKTASLQREGRLAENGNDAAMTGTTCG